MAVRPWVTPQEVREYSEITEVKSRTDKRLEMDIARAEQYVIQYTNNKFEKDSTVPESIKIAVILLAESYAYNAVISTKEMKSETFDDYSYTAELRQLSVNNLDLKSLLDEYVITAATNRVTLRIRKL